MSRTPLSDLYAALSATNEVLLYAKTVSELYRGVCHAAVDGGHFLTAAVTVPKRSGWLRVEAVAGHAAETLRAANISVDEATPEGRGLVGLAFRTQTPQISHDYLNDERTQPWHAVGRKAGVASGAAVPFVHKGQTIGVLIFYSAEPDAFSPETISLLERMARNIVFALGNFEREAERLRAEQALVHSEEKYRNILESLDDAYYEVDLRGQPVYHNGAFMRMLGYTPETIAGHDNRDRQTPEMAVAVFRAFNEVYRTGQSKTNQEWEYISQEGKRLRVEGSVMLVKNPEGQAAGFRGILRDITKRRKYEQALRESEARFRALTQLSSDWYWEKDDQLRFTRLEGRSAQAARHPRVGMRLWEGEFTALCEGGWEALQDVLLMRENFRDVVIHRTLEDGSPCFLTLSGEPVFDPEGRFVGYRGISREVTEQKMAEEQIKYLARHDVLTGLPNRLMFGQLLDSTLRTALRYQRRFAVLFIDLDRFKIINDTLGHAAGDSLLKQVAARFGTVLRSSDIIARLGGDEFVVLAQEAQDREQAAVVAQKLIHAAIEPITVAGHECRVTASVGIALFPADGQDEQTLMKNADVAMYHAKEQGKNNLQFYDPELNAQTAHRLTIESQLRHALANNEFTLHYQPKLNLKTQQVTGVEALLRWTNPLLGSVSPAQFIPVAEESGLIISIGLWVLRTACAQAVAWQHQGLPPLAMAVNLSMRQFADEKLYEQIENVVNESGIEPSLLELEVTEGMLAHNTERALQVLHALKDLEVRLAVDDFGTGYSSLGQLKNFPIDTLKIDRSFVRDLANSVQDKAITAAIIAMGRTLGIKLVAEGVETPEQQAFLTEQGCDEMQGYLFCKPMPPEGMSALIARTKRAT